MSTKIFRKVGQKSTNTQNNQIERVFYVVLRYVTEADLQIICFR